MERKAFVKAIITVVGQDRTGIIAAVTAKLASYGINVLDINQTVLQEYFTMIMLVDLSGSGNPFEEIKNGLTALGEEMGMSMRIQHEDIFNAMHKI